MPRTTKGSVYREKQGTIGIRWPEGGRRPQRGGFRTKTEARNWFDENVAPRLRRGGPSAEITLDEFCDLFLERHTGGDRTKRTFVDRLRPVRAQFGSWSLRDLEGAAEDIARWRATLGSDSAKFRHTQAFRSVLEAAVRWRYLQTNAAVEAGSNPKPRQEELHPFTRNEIDRLCEELGPRDASLVVFVAETGLRTNEWTALERGDIDRLNPAVTIQRRFASGVLTPYPKTENARRRVPLTDRAVEALQGLPPRLDTTLLFSNSKGTHIGLDRWRSWFWYPALDAAGIEKRGPYALRHTFATEALAAGVSIFQLARLMGTSVAMIDATYGHAAQDTEGYLRGVLNARSGSVVASADSTGGAESAG